MKKSVFFGTLAAASALAGIASADTLADIKARGELICGTNTGLTGFAAPDANGVYQGFDVAVCKAIAAAVLGDDILTPDTTKSRQDPERILSKIDGQEGQKERADAIRSTLANTAPD